MDWILAAGRFHEKLLTVIAELFALARIIPGERPELEAGAQHNQYMTTLPRYVFKAVMLLLEPAEAALRRLLIIVAHGHGWAFKPRQDRGKPFPLFFSAGAKGISGVSRGGICVRGPGSNADRTAGDAGIPGFVQRDWSIPGLGLANQHVPVKTGPGALPRIPAFNMFDPLPAFRNYVPFYEAGAEPPAPARPFPGVIPAGKTCTPVSAILLWRRINALHYAAEDLEKSARRYARWKAKRDHALKHNLACSPNRLGLMRPGRPPGWSKKWRHQIDEVLNETHYFACDALSPTGKRKLEIGWD
jgi:hypothetical protein